VAFIAKVKKYAAYDIARRMLHSKPSDQPTIDGEPWGHPPALIAYYKKCCAHIAFQTNPDFSGIPPILEIPPPLADIDCDETAIKEDFEGFFRRQCGQTVEIRFVASH
jgi:hypothetical protein